MMTAITRMRRGRAITAVVLGLVGAMVGFLAVQADTWQPGTREIQDYAAHVHEKAPTVIAQKGRAGALVTFRHPLTAERFNSLMAQPGISVESFRIRVIKPNGERAIIGGAPEPDGTILDPAHVFRVAAQAKDNAGGNLAILGVFDARVTIDQSSYEALRAVPDVFLVDPVQDNSDNQFLLYHAMEDAGLAG
ncbi:hypothetical protein [Nitrolancea hollandica]|uniref:Uncharacterized protein n=1 Tax=Nitrolancea hollandica Lb TaxID=1129897 RepID=I4EKG3_9BACT|nr:hypothetical protein [Nitrolancea hollandica]CCF85175.1 conserved exported hypothetical protein [Nitrolancea hollandica Lb]